jgi:Abortive infection alpha
VTDPDESLDVLGIKPVSEAINTATQATVAGAGAFLGRICLPAAEEFGLLLQDKVRNWRAKNALAITARAEEFFNALPNANGRRAHPRIVGAVMEHGSWADEDDVRSMWAGLLASACTESGRDQENLIYVNLLEQLTTSQARTLSFACSKAEKFKTETGLILARELIVTLEQIIAASGTVNIHTLDLEIDNLRGLGLLDPMSGLSISATQPHRLTPTPIGLQLYIRCQGFVGSPIEYFKL